MTLVNGAILYILYSLLNPFGGSRAGACAEDTEPLRMGGSAAARHHSLLLGVSAPLVYAGGGGRSASARGT